MRTRILGMVTALIVAGVALFGRDRIATLFAGTTEARLPISSLLSDLQAIPLHPGDRMDGGIRSFDKTVIVGATMHVSTDSPMASVIAYYVETLPRLGWVRSDDDRRPDEVKFCKSGTSLLVQASNDKDHPIYYIGVVWTSYRGSQSYCPRTAT